MLGVPTERRERTDIRKNCPVSVTQGSAQRNYSFHLPITYIEILRRITQMLKRIERINRTARKKKGENRDSKEIKVARAK